MSHIKNVFENVHEHCLSVSGNMVHLKSFYLLKYEKWKKTWNANFQPVKHETSFLVYFFHSAESPACFIFNKYSLFTNLDSGTTKALQQVDPNCDEDENSVAHAQ